MENLAIIGVAPISETDRALAMLDAIDRRLIIHCDIGMGPEIERKIAEAGISMPGQIFVIESRPELPELPNIQSLRDVDTSKFIKYTAQSFEPKPSKFTPKYDGGYRGRTKKRRF